MDPSTSSSLNMKTTCHHLEDPSYFEDAVSMQVSKDGQIQMVNWLSRDDRPWTGLHDTTLETQPQALPNYLTDRATHDSFMEYRSTGMPSECETIPGDSGYGSCFPPSVENTSVYGEEPFPPAQDVEQDLSSFHLSMQDTMHMDTPCETGKAQGIATKALQSPDANILCPECGNWVKTRSELK